MGFFENEDLALLSAHHRLCFAGLWLLSDKAGRLEDRPKRIRARLFPYEAELDVDAFLHDLKVKGFINRYVVGDLHLIQVREFLTHQRPRHDEPDSEYPAQPHDAIGQPLSADLSVFSPTVTDRTLPSDISPPGIGIGMGTGMEKGNGKEALTRVFTPSHLHALWNLTAETMGLRPCLALSGDRLAQAKQRLKEQPNQAYWETVIQRIASSAFCRGANDRGWKADMDFLLRKNSAVKALEGKYDDTVPIGPLVSKRTSDLMQSDADFDRLVKK